MVQAESPRPRNLGLRDLVGLVAGYGLAGLLLRHRRPGDGADLQTLVGFWGAYLWFGLAMSGPIVLWIGRLGEPGRLPPRAPRRPGRPIAEVPAGAAPDRVDPGDEAGATAGLTFNEYLWIGIGGFWATLTLGLPTPIGWDVRWSSLAATPGVAWLVLGPWIVGSMRRGSPSRSWTHPVASAVVLAWPFAALMLLLASGSFGG